MGGPEAEPPSVSLERSLGPSGAVRSAHLPVKEKAAGSNPVWGALLPFFLFPIHTWCGHRTKERASLRLADPYPCVHSGEQVLSNAK
jgi:hypothetical protein